MYQAFFRDGFRMFALSEEPRSTSEEAVKDVERYLADEWVEFMDGTRGRRRAVPHGPYCVATVERHAEIANPQGSWCSITPTPDELVVLYKGRRRYLRERAAGKLGGRLKIHP